MDLAALFTDAGLNVPTGHAAFETDALPEALLNVGIGIIASAVERGVDLPDAPAQLRAARNAERAFNAISTLRTQLIAKADQTGAADIDGLSMADVIAEERKIPKDDATSHIRKAVARTAFPNALAAAAASRISQDNLDTAVATLTKLRPHYSQDEFPAVEQALLKEAEVAIPAAFKKKCRTTLELLDQTLRKANNAATAKRRKQVYDDRGISIKLIEDGEFGAQIWGTIPPEYLRILMPALDKKSEAIARAQRHSKARKAADRRIRLLDAIFTLATGTKPPTLDDLDTIYGDSDENTDAPTNPEDTTSNNGADATKATNREHTEHCEDAAAQVDTSTTVQEELSLDLTADTDLDHGPHRYKASSTLLEDSNDTNVGHVAPDDHDDLENLDHEAGLGATTHTGKDTDSDEPSNLADQSAGLSHPERTRHLWDTTDADLARTSRLASKELRKLLALRDGGCVFPMCTDPPERCIAHHIKPWEDGGETNLRNLALICSRHHPRVEHPPGEPDYWTILIDDAGLPAARPPRRIDPHQGLIYHPRLTAPTCTIPLPGQQLGAGETGNTATAGTVQGLPNNVGENSSTSGFEIASDWRFDQKIHGPPPF